MSQVEIKNRWTGAVLFTAELGAEYDSESASVRMGAAVKMAISVGARLVGARLDGARLVGARLDGARLDGARLDGARLDGASLVGASLDGASLDGASLDGASLDGASLVGARLDGARLVGARLDGAKLRDDLLLVGKRPVLQIGPVGSRSAYFMAHLTTKGLYLRAGCFFGTRAEFEEKLASEHGDNEHAQEYRAALEFIAVHESLWTPDESKSEAA